MLEAVFQITGWGWVLAVQVSQWTGELRIGDTLRITLPGGPARLCQVADLPQYARFSPPRPNPPLAFLSRGWTPEPSAEEWKGATVSLVLEPMS